jgi:two-component system response regulator FlrC
VPNAQGKLLIVDDELGIRKALSDILCATVSNIQVACDGKEALEICRSRPIDVVISDIAMPNMNGLELLAHVRNIDLEMPFIFLTGYGDKEKAVEALRLGATDFLDKPFDPVEVIEIVSKAIELARALKAVEVEVAKMYTQYAIPEDKRIELRKMKMAIMMMKRFAKIYSK